MAKSESSQRVVLITGGGSGIGERMASMFAAKGDFVVVTDVSRETGERVAREIRQTGCRAEFKLLDVAKEEAVIAVSREISERFGAADVLINSAGILQRRVPFHELQTDEHDRIVDVNYRGTYLCCRHFGTSMAAARKGVILNIASTSGLSAMPGIAYGPSKAAVISLTGTLAVHLGAAGVRVNAIAPGTTITPPMQQWIDTGERDLESIIRYNALPRAVEPDDVAEAAYFLSSPAAAAITGITLPVDCGWLAGISWVMHGGPRPS